MLTGVDLARYDRVVIADDDVRYRKAELDRTVSLLDTYDLIRPQNYFSPLPWHALWDTARTLLNRATIGADFPGTLAVRRSSLLDAGGYDGDVLFENLELIRRSAPTTAPLPPPRTSTSRAYPPAPRTFSASAPARLTTIRDAAAHGGLAGPPAGARYGGGDPSTRRGPRGRRSGDRAGRARTPPSGRDRGVPPAASVLAPLWVLERAVCSWLAVLQRLRFGGARYGNSIIPTAAHSESTLRRRAATRLAFPRRAPSQAHRLGTGSQPVGARGWREADRWPPHDPGQHLA